MEDSQNPQDSPENLPDNPSSNAPAAHQDSPELRDEEESHPHNGKDDPSEYIKTIFRGAKPIEVAQFVINAALAVIGVFAICIYGEQLNTMKRQLSDSEAAQRASLIFETFEADWPDETSPIQIHCTIWNAGQTPARAMAISSGGGGGGKIPLDKNGNRFLPPIGVLGIPNPSETGPSLGQDKRTGGAAFEFSGGPRLGF